MPAIASDRLVELHNDLAHYDTDIATHMREFLRGNSIAPYSIRVDQELDEALRTFKPETAAEIECRRDLLRYKRRIDDVVRDLTRLIEQRSEVRQPARQSDRQMVEKQAQKA